MFVKATVLILASLLYGNLYGQIEIDYGFHINPKLSKFIYEDNSVSTADKTLTYSLGGIFFLRKNQFEISTGINFNRLSINQIDYSPIFGCDINLSSGADIYNSYFRDNYQIYYLGLPVNIFYLFTKKKNFYIDVGGEFLIRQSEKNKTYLVECGNNERQVSGNPTSKTQNTLFKINSGIGYLYEKEKYTIFIEPIVEYSITKIYEESGVISDLTNNARSLEFGIKIGFKI